MKRLTQAGICIALFAGGVAVGFVIRDRQPDPTLQDYALTSIMNDLLYAAKLDADKSEEVRQLLDVRLFDDVTHARNSDTVARRDSESVKARMRILAGVAALWRAAPPPDSKVVSGAKNQPWFADWMSMYEANYKYVSDADAACLAAKCTPIYPKPSMVSGVVNCRREAKSK